MVKHRKDIITSSYKTKLKKKRLKYRIAAVITGLLVLSSTIVSFIG